MAVKTLICGLSGTGKSRSMKPFAEAGERVAVVNPVNKPLPFKNKFSMLDGETDARKIMAFMVKAANDGIKTIVVDDFQYLLSIPYMHRIRESGWDKYNDFAANYFQIIEVCDSLPKDVTVYFMTHTETLEDGQETVKLIGKLLREKICIEGLFTIVLKTLVSDGKYYFVTQNNGHDNVKSPEDMFQSYAIDNDLKYVDEKIRNYYEIGEFLTDEEMAEIDEKAKKVDVFKDDGKKGRRRAKKEEPKNPSEEEKKEENEKPAHGRRKRVEENMDNDGESAGEKPESAEDVGGDVPKKRTRKNREVAETFRGEDESNDSGTVEAPARKGRNAAKREAADREFLENAPAEGENTEVPFDESDGEMTGAKKAYEKAQAKMMNEPTENRRSRRRRG